MPEVATASAFAPAKVNLYLHVGALDGEGFHPVCSLMVFADVGDRVTIAPADAFSFRAAGPFAAGIDGVADDNLVVRAVRGLEAEAGRALPPFSLTLEKALPVAAGLGGGSSDAGAALMLVNRAHGLGLSMERLEAVAARLGSDGPVCLHARPAVGQGRGERLSPAPAMRPLPAVLVNPGAPSPTGAVYRAFVAESPGRGAYLPVLPAAFATVQDVAAALASTTNDLEAPAVRLTPGIGEALAALSAEPEALIARMSGSGATAFALTATDGQAMGLALRLASAHPEWWVRACRLGGPWTGDERDPSITKP